MRTSFEGNVQVAWDATSLELFQTCPRKYYYRMIENITPRHTSVHLLFGMLYASALEHFYLRRAEGASIEEALRMIVREAMEESWDQAASQPKDFDTSVSAGAAGKTRFNLIRSIVWYIDQFADESSAGITTHHLASGKPAVELSFTIELNDDILWCGHLDRVVSYAGGLYWMDQKTSGTTISPRFFEQFKPHNQFYGYTWAGQLILHSPLKGGIIDAAQIAVGFTRFERHPITVTQDQLEEWHTNTVDTIERAQATAERGKWPMNLTACGNYGGCPYRILCSRSPSIRDKFIEGDFVHPEPWDPLKAR
jgi:hypothetical protein